MEHKTLKEINQQPDVWRSALEAVERNRKKLLRFFESVTQGAELILTGCGTSYYLPLAAASFYTHLTGESARGVSASEILLFPDTVFAEDRDCLLIPISRKGRTEETNRAAQYVREKIGGRALAVSCTPASPLSELCEETIVIPEAAEESKFMTKSFTSMLLAFQHLTVLRRGNESFIEELYRLPVEGERIIREYTPLVERLAAELPSRLYIYLGQGPFYGLAAEAMLKVKEMACTCAEAYHSLELMHGPKYAIDERTLVVLLLSETGAGWELPLLAKIKSLGATILVVCERAAPEIAEAADSIIELKSGLSEYARLLLYMPPLQLFAYYCAVKGGKEVE